MGICEDIAAGTVAQKFAELVPDDAVDASNCPATAAALLAYVQSGQLTPVPNASFVQTYNFSEVRWRQRTWAQLVGAVNESGQAVVVEAARSANVEGDSQAHRLQSGEIVTRHHYFVVFRCGTTVYVGDAFRVDMFDTATGVLRASDSAAWREHNEYRTYRMSRSFQVTPNAQQ